MMRFVPVALALPLALAAATASASGGADQKPHFVPVDEVSVPIIDGDRTNGTLRFKLVLEIGDEAAAHRLTAAMPLLRAASLNAGIEFARLYASPMMPVDARRLASEMTLALQHQDASIARVLLVEVSARAS